MATRAPAKKAAAKKVAAKKSAAPKSARKQASNASSQPAAAKKSAKPAKIKLVRDSFTIPKAEYATIDQLKQRAAKTGLPSKKSEVLRAGLMALASMGDASFQAAMSAVPTLKTGRPRKA
jgi:hypothetical protein